MASVLSVSTDAVNLDKEYLPTLNTKRFQDFPDPFEQVFLHFLLICKTETERVRELYKVRENVRYGGLDDNQLLDIYYKEEEKGTPLFVFIHGGYWKLLDKSSAGIFVAPLVERGYRVMVVDYNLCPNVTLSQLVQQTKNLFSWIYKYADETDTRDIFLAGHSAGAHLLSLLLNITNFPELPLAQHTKALFLISGVYDLRVLWQLESVNTNNIFSLDAKTATELSPLCWELDSRVVEFFKQQNIKIHALVAEHDSDTFIAQTKKLAEKLIAAGFEENDVKLKIFEGYDHFDIIEEASQSESDINRYIMNNL